MSGRTELAATVLRDLALDLGRLGGPHTRSGRAADVLWVLAEAADRAVREDVACCCALCAALFSRPSVLGGAWAGPVERAAR